jgi:ATP-dependent helicase/nuclease subunit A
MTRIDSARRRALSDLFVVTGPESSREASPKASEGPPDYKERERALDIGRSWIVEAPAGSGKTGLLIQRFLKLLGHDSVVEPEQVLAITFTKKATQEIRDRVMEQLESAAQKTPLKRTGEFERTTRTLAESVLERDEMLGWGLLERPRRLRVRTIDSVCQEIAASLPVLSGSGGELRPVEDAALLYGEAARRTLMELGGHDAVLHEALKTLLLHRDGNVGDCERLLAEMLVRREQWRELIPVTGKQLTDEYLDGTVRPRLERALEQAICVGLTRVARAVPEDILRRMALLAGEFADLPPYKPEVHPFAICRGMRGAPEQTVQQLEHWRAMMSMLVKKDGNWRARFSKNNLGVEIEKTHSTAVRILVDELRERDDVLRAVQSLGSLPPATYPDEQWRVAKALFRVLSHALAELQVVFAERGECDFAELTLLALTALEEGGAGEMTTALGMRLEHLLVDEMQDTSTSHYEVIQLLTQGWDGQSQTVFLVGDPKQSIYLFRQARVQLFLKTMETERLGELPLGRLRLTANFRSQGALVDAFNEDFALLFAREASASNDGEVTFVEAAAVRAPASFAGGSAAVTWHAHALPAGLTKEQKRKKKRAQAKQDAAMVHAIVKRWRARPLPEGRSDPWKIAVLVRSRSYLTDVVAVLKENNGEGAIPFRAVNIEPLKERQEVLDLSALTRALLHPADRVAWLAVLHAPWCGLGLAELHVLAGGDDPAWAERCMLDVIDERGDLLSEDGCARLAKVWPVLRAATAQRAKLTTAQWVERTWRSLGGDAWITADQMVNARRYLQVLDEVEQQAGMLDLGLLQRRIDKLYAAAAVVADAVDLMTIHGAKGLEWDVVMVPGLERREPPNRSRLLTWEEIDTGDEEAAHVVLAPIAGKGEGSKELNGWLHGIHNARETAERKRLFYVACTRAREELHLFAAPEITAKGEIGHTTGSLLDTAWPTAERYFAGGAPAFDTAAKVFVMQPANAPEAEFLGEIAAVAGDAEEMQEVSRPAKLQRLPIGFDPRERFRTGKKLPYGEDNEAQIAPHFARPEGSFEARALGNAVHAFMEILTKRLGDGVPGDALLPEMSGLGSRITAVLRGEGLSQASANRLALRVQSALRGVLQDSEGLWVLGAHEGSSSEYALTAWGDRRNSVRLDRVFRAGETPLTAGSDYLWIIDYKTATHGRGGVDEFLAEERVKYGPQMLAYAQMMRGKVERGRIRVGLYYPMLPRLVWWTPETE